MIAGGGPGTPEQGAAGGQGPRGDSRGSLKEGWLEQLAGAGGAPGHGTQLQKNAEGQRICQGAAPEQVEQRVGSQGESFSFTL